jgi:hypothetical protein
VQTLAITFLIPSCETLAAHEVLAHQRTVFLPCTCGLRGGAAATAALADYEGGGDNRDQLLPLHRCAHTLDRRSNSSSAALHV